MIVVKPVRPTGAPLGSRTVRRASEAGAVGALALTLALAAGCRSLPEAPGAAPTATVASSAAPEAASPSGIPSTGATTNAKVIPPAATGSAAPDAPPPSREPDGTVHSTLAYWRCAAPTCGGEPWGGAVVSWPSWAAYQGNARRSNAGRDVYSAGGRPLYPYMGTWANGCEVTVLSGFVEVIEWKRGSETWRSTRLKPGETHVIALKPPEDGAMFEAPGGTPAFSVTLKNCTPKPLP